MNESVGLRAVLAEQEWNLLGDLIDAVVPGGAGAMKYLDRRYETGHLDIGDIRDALSGSESAGIRLEVWSAADADSREKRWFETLRSWSWEAFLCDPSWGGNHEERGWRRFGYSGRPKSADRSDPI